MAISYVGGATVPLSSDPEAISLTGLTGGSDTAPSENDYVLVGLVEHGASDVSSSISIGTGYTALATLYADNNNDTNFKLARKIMGPTPDTTVSVSPGAASPAWEKCSVIVKVFRGVDLTTPEDVAVTTATGISSGAPNGPSITPTTSGAWVTVWGGGTISADGNTLSQSGSELSNFIEETNYYTTDSDGACMAAGDFSWTSGAFDPAVWVANTGDASFMSWTAASIALRPSTGEVLTAEAGSFTLTGGDVTFSKTYILGAETGSFALTGSAANLEYGRVLSATSGSFALTGSDVSLHKGFTLTAEAGTFTLTGSAATLTRNVPLTAEGGSFTLSGRDIRQLFIFKPGSSPSGWTTAASTSPAEWETLL